MPSRASGRESPHPSPSRSAPSFAATHTVAVPESEKPGARATFPVAVPVPGVVVVTVAYVGPDTFANVNGFPSGSVAESGLLAVAPSFTVTLAGCAKVGGVLAAGAEPAPSQSNQSPAIPVTVPHGSDGLPTTYVFGKKNPSQSVPNPVPNPKGLSAPGPICSPIEGLPEAGVTGSVPIELRPGGEVVPEGRALLISISVELE